MIASLRKRHKVMWLMIGLLLPVLCILSVINRPSMPLNSTEYGHKVVVTGEIIRSIDADNLIFNLRGENNTIEQVEIISKQSLKNASAIVYPLVDGKKFNALGQIGNKGVKRFAIGANVNGILVYDILKEQEIYKVNF